MNRHCPDKCSVTLTDDAAVNFCWKCGKALVNVLHCVCGREIGFVDRFCVGCGRAIEQHGVAK